MGDRAALEGAVIHDGDDEDLGGAGESYAATGRTSGAEPQKLLSKGNFLSLLFFSSRLSECIFAYFVLSEYVNILELVV